MPVYVEFEGTAGRISHESEVMPVLISRVGRLHEGGADFTYKHIVDHPKLIGEVFGNNPLITARVIDNITLDPGLDGVAYATLDGGHRPVGGEVHVVVGRALRVVDIDSVKIQRRFCALRKGKVGDNRGANEQKEAKMFHELFRKRMISLD